MSLSHIAYLPVMAGEKAVSIPEISPTSCNEGYFFAISSLVVGIIMT